MIREAKTRIRASIGTMGMLVAVSCWAQTPSQLSVDEGSFGCIREMKPVRGFYVDNLIKGQLPATLTAANNEKGASYPPGSVVQLVPGEVMVKHPQGFNPTTNDWEFFELAVSSQGTKINKRGFVDVENKFGGNCFACHIKAKPQWDMICESDHGCDPLPIGREMFALIQKTDPRCKDNPKLTDEELQKLMQLKQALQHPAKDG